MASLVNRSLCALKTGQTLVVQTQNHVGFSDVKTAALPKTTADTAKGDELCSELQAGASKLFAEHEAQTTLIMTVWY